MSSTQDNQNAQEVDLGAVANKIGGVFKQLFGFVSNLVLFFWKFKFISAVLFIGGFIGGFILDIKPSTYEHIAIVVPNFKSVDDTYTKVSLIDSKIVDQDAEFFKSIGIDDVKAIKSISIKSIVDPFKFTEYNKERFEMIKLMADDSNVASVIQGDVMNRNYIYHKLSIHTREPIKDRELIDKILNFLNSNPFYEDLKKIQIKQAEMRLFAYDTTIKHIDNILTAFGKTGSIKTNSILVGENVALDEVLVLRDRFVRDKERLSLDKTLYDRIVKDVTLEMNLRGKETFGGKAKLFLPLILLGLFFVFMRKKG